MKRLSAFILLIIYFVTTTGATLQIHYCMGKFAGWSIATKSVKKCGKCGMKKKADADNGCCKDENQLVKIQDDQKANYISCEISKLTSPDPVYPDNNLIFSIAEERAFLPQSNAPPRSSTTSLHIINCTFRI